MSEYVLTSIGVKIEYWGGASCQKSIAHLSCAKRCSWAPFYPQMGLWQQGTAQALLIPFSGEETVEAVAHHPLSRGSCFWYQTCTERGRLSTSRLG